MQEKTWHYCKDKHLWGDGPWVTEPDRVQWLDEETGYWCLARRNWHTGGWCGYVAISPSHPYFHKIDRKHTESSSRLGMKLAHEALQKYGGFANMPEDAIPDVYEQHPDFEEKLYDLNVHGGVTYTGCSEKQNTKEDWLQWRQQMLSRLPEADQYPKGDAANDWLECEKLVNDYEAYKSDCDVKGLKLLGVEGEWWLVGFDCGHYQDYMPCMAKRMEELLGHTSVLLDPENVYRDLNYVKGECRSLARQLKEIEIDAIPEVPMTAEQIDRIVKYVIEHDDKQSP
jgi:hypothetical protein